MEEFALKSSAFKGEAHIPRKHTADGPGSQYDLSPPLSWHEVPEGTETFALIVEDIDAPDPEAPIAPFTHWVVANIPAILQGLPQGFSTKDIEEDSDLGKCQEGINDFKVPHYKGPLPPTGVHRYVFTLYALDSELHVGKRFSKEKLLELMEGHILGEAKLTGLYTREKGSSDAFVPGNVPAHMGVRREL